MRGLRVTIMLLGAALLASGCSATVTGVATRDPLTTSAPATSTATSTATPTPTPAPEPSVGTIIEAHRIAGATVLIQAALPDLVDHCNPAGPFIDSASTEGDLGIFAAGSTAPILDAYGFVAAWTNCRNVVTGTDEPSSDEAMIVFVAEMSDPDSAQIAADELGATAQSGDYAKTDIDGVPEARAGQAQRSGEGASYTVTQLWMPVDRMLVYAFASGSGDGAAGTVDDLSELLIAQQDLLAEFTPTPQSEVAALPVDPQGIQGLVTDPPGDFSNYSGPYDLQSYLRIAIDPDGERTLLQDNGFTGTFLKQSTSPGGFRFQVQVYELGSLEEADAVFAEFTRIEQEEFSNRTVFSVPTAPSAPCFSFPDDAVAGQALTYYHRCYVRGGTHLAGIDVGGLPDPADISLIAGLVTQQIKLID